MERNSELKDKINNLNKITLDVMHACKEAGNMQ